MADLSSFSPVQPSSIDDFKLGAEASAPVSNRASNVNLAAHAAAVTGDSSSVVQAFQDSNAQLDMQGKSETASALLQSAKDATEGANKAALATYLADPTVGDAQKQAAALAVLDKNNAMYQNNNVLSNMALVAPAAHNEPVETEVARVSLADAIAPVNEYKRQSQALLNREVAKADPAIGKTVAELVEILIPGAQEKYIGSIASGLNDTGKGNPYAAAFVLMGNSQAEIKALIDKAPPEERMQIAQKVVDIVNQHSSIVMPGDNDFARVDQLRRVLEDGYYGDGTQLIDNIVSVLDLTVLGGLAARTARGAKAGVEAAFTGGRISDATVSSLERDMVRSRVQPSTVSQNYKDTNPRLASAAHEAAAVDETGQAADALYGTSRADAVGNDILPEVGKVDGSVSNKVGRPESVNDAKVTPDAQVMDFVNHDGAIHYFQSEKKAMRSRVVNNFEQAQGMNARKEMFQVENLSDGVGVKAVYGPPQGGFGTPEQALAMARWSLREAGVEDSAITILKRDGDRYVPSTVDEMNALRAPETLSERTAPLRQAGEPVATSRPFYKTTGGDTRYIAPSDSTIYVSKEDAGRLRKAAGTGRRTIAYDARTEQAVVERGTGSPAPESLVKASRTPEPGMVPVDIGGKRPVFGDEIVEVGDHPTTSITSSVKVTRKQTPDFLVQVEHKYKFSPGDVAQWAEADVKYNIFDRVDMLNGTANAGSLQRHLVDAHSMLHPNITLGANVAVDRAAGLERQLLKVGDQFTKEFKALPKDRQNLLDKYIKEANAQGIEHSRAKLVADGVTDKEIGILNSWREYWDTIYHLENKDLAKSMRARNYHEFVDEVNGTRLFARPVARSQAEGNVKVYDHVTDSIRTMRADEITELYAKEGTLARLRQPIQAGDEAAEFILSEQKVGGTYLRALNEDSQVLNYRKGYYSVNYKDPHFIVQVVKNSRGETLYERAVATAGNAKDADLMVQRMSATDGGSYYRRNDTRKMDMSSNNYWDLQQAQGRSAQKVRGKRLEESSSNAMDPTQTNILNPVDSMIASARSVSRRVAMRDFTEASKSRFLDQYKDFLPKGRYGEPAFPSNVSEVKHYGGVTPSQSKLADARTTFEYLRYIENGYVNAIDDTYKATLKALGDIAGSAGLAKGERALSWMSEGRGPSAMAKNIAFNMYLATNPLRQFVIQSHQAVQLMAFNPRWVLEGKAVPEVSLLTSYQMGYRPAEWLLKGAGLTEEQALSMYKAFERTGQVAAIDKQNLIRGSLMDMADTIAGNKITKTLTSPLNFMRKVGFDAGENINTMTSWLAHRDAAIRKGEDFSRADVQDRVSGLARNFTYNMNAAGDMPYNQNMLAMVFQFMQVPHKAMLGMLTNRNLSTVQKARLVGFNAVMYTLPPAAMYSLFGSILPDDKDQREAVVQGLEGLMLNKLVSLSTGEESRIDFSGLSPMDLYGTGEFIHSLFTTDTGTLVASTPSGQLLFGNNPRLTNFAKTTARYFNLIDDYQDPVEFGRVASDFAKLSSGYSNAFKAAYALKYGQKISATGGVTDSQVTRPEAVAQVFGFASLDEAQRRYINDVTYKKSKAFEDDVKAWYKDFKREMYSVGEVSQQDRVTKTLSEAWRVFGNDDYRAKQIIAQELKNDLSAGDDRLYQSTIRMNGILSPDEVKNLVHAMPGYDETKRQAMLETLDFMNSYKEEQ